MFGRCGCHETDARPATEVVPVDIAEGGGGGRSPPDLSPAASVAAPRPRRRILINPPRPIGVDGAADVVRALLVDRGVLALDLWSQPGDGSELLCATARTLSGLSVVVASRTSDVDLARLRAAAAQAMRVTASASVDTAAVAEAVSTLDPARGRLVVFVSPAPVSLPVADLEADASVLVLPSNGSAETPLGMPGAVRAARLAVLTACEDGDADALATGLRRVNPKITVRPVTSENTAGFRSWLGWLAIEQDARALA